MESRRREILICIVLLVTVVTISGCIVRRLIPAPKRSFTTSNLLITEAELPLGWSAPSGPRKDTDNKKPVGSMQINLYTSPGSTGADITQRAAIYPSVEQAKAHFSEDTQFPGETEIKGWSFHSDKADEEKFSCYTYSNVNYPICTWWIRYQEIMIEVIGRLEPGHLSLEEMQTIVKTIDDKVVKKLDEK